MEVFGVRRCYRFRNPFALKNNFPFGYFGAVEFPALAGVQRDNQFLCFCDLVPSALKFLCCFSRHLCDMEVFRLCEHLGVFRCLACDPALLLR